MCTNFQCSNKLYCTGKFQLVFTLAVFYAAITSDILCIVTVHGSGFGISKSQNTMKQVHINITVKIIISNVFYNFVTATTM